MFIDNGCYITLTVDPPSTSTIYQFTVGLLDPKNYNINIGRRRLIQNTKKLAIFAGMKHLFDLEF